MAHSAAPRIQEERAGFVVERRDGKPGTARILVRGDLDLTRADDLARAVESEVRTEDRSIEIDLKRLGRVDGGSLAQLLALRARIRDRGKTCEFVGAAPDLERLLDLYGCPNDYSCLKPAPTKIGTLDHIGRATVEVVRSTRGILHFTGAAMHSLMAAIRRPRTVHIGDLGGLMERTGADAAPIVVLINFLVGLIIALQSATQLERFGASIFVADLVALSVLRELAPLMTAIVVAGRSGAAYAAELGTMRVNEEIDALDAMRIDPIRYLVFPRVIALALVVPALAVLGAVTGCAGGLVIAVFSLDLSAETYLHGIRNAVGFADFVSGQVKAVFFAIAIAFVACQRGLATEGGAEGVGRSTTSAGARSHEKNSSSPYS